MMGFAAAADVMDERLKGTRVRRYGMRINDHYRVTFRWESGHAYEVGVEDYH